MRLINAALSVVRRVLIARAGGLDLTKIDKIPANLVWLLERDGLRPVDKMSDLRESTPVAKVTNLLGLQIWMITGDAEVREVLAAKDTYSNDIRPYLGGGKLGEQGVGGLGFTDPPEHTRLRKLLTPEFTMRRLARLNPLIDEVIESRLVEIERQGADGSVDLADVFAFPVPFMVICDLLGMRHERRGDFSKVAAARFDVSGGGVGAFGAATEMLDFLEEEVRLQRVDPGPGLIGQIIRDVGDEITDVDLAGLADGVFTGGLETSASMLGLGAAVLLEQRHLWQQLQDDPGSVDKIVDELLRLLTPVQWAFPRFAKQDVVVGGQQIPKGAVLVCHLPAANRDPRATAGDDLDLDRASGSHLAFGFGFHRCVGAELAKLELRKAFPAMAARFPDMTLVKPIAELDYRPSSIVYGADELMVLPGRARHTADSAASDG